MAVLGCVTDVSGGNNSSGMAPAGRVSLGMAITPKNFPAHTMADIDEAFALARQLGDHSVLIYQWGNLDLNVARLMCRLSPGPCCMTSTWMSSMPISTASDSSKLRVAKKTATMNSKHSNNPSDSLAGQLFIGVITVNLEVV